MKCRLGHRQAGFTLVELLLVITVTTILALVVTNILLGNTEQSVLGGGKQTVLRETEQSLDLMTNDIRLSANANLNNQWPDPNDPGGTANEYDWTSNSSTLVLATAATDKNDNIIFSDSKNYITQKNNLVYFVSGGTLYKRVIANPVSGNSAVTSCPAAKASASCPADKELLHNITLFNITYLDGDDNSVSPPDARSIQIHVEVSQTIYGHLQTADYTTRMVFRND